MLTPSGALTSIDRLCLGDDVMAFDADGALHCATVRGRMSFLSEKHYEISLSNGSMVRVTASHPVAVAPGIFSRADTLAEGHSVMIHSCDDVMLGSATVEHVKCVADNAVVYNLSTAPHHTFFAAGLAVHNKGGGGGGGGCFSGDVAVTVIKRNSLGFVDQKRVPMRQLQAGDEIKGALLSCRLHAAHPKCRLWSCHCRHQFFAMRLRALVSLSRFGFDWHRSHRRFVVIIECLQEQLSQVIML